MAGLHKFHQIIEELSKKMETDIKANVLLNDISPSSKDFSIIEGLVDNLSHFKLMQSKVAHRADFYKTMEEGSGVSELPSGKAKDEIKAVIKEIKKIYKEN